MMRSLARSLGDFIWVRLVAPHYEDSPMPNCVFDWLFGLSGRLEYFADTGEW